MEEKNDSRRGRLRAYLKSLTLHDYVSLLGFLALILLAMNLGGYKSSGYTSVLSCVLFATGVYVFLDKDKEKGGVLLREEKRSFWVYVSPLLVFSFFLIVSFFWMSGGFSSVLLSFISVLGFGGSFLLFYSFRRDHFLSLEILIGGALVALSFVTFSNLIATLSQYGFFHLERFTGYVYYREGIAYPLDAEVAILDGLSISFVSKEFGLLPAFILASALPTLLYVNPKKEMKRYLLISIPSVLGLLSLVLVGSFQTLLFLLPIYLLGILFRFLRLPLPAPRWERILVSSLLVLAGIAIIGVMGIAANGKDIYSGSAVLSRLFDNGRLMNGINKTVATVFKDGFLSARVFFGMPVYDIKGFGELGSSNLYSFVSWDGVTSNWTSYKLRTFEFAALMEGGIFAFIALCVFFLFLFPTLRRYLRLEENGILCFAPVSLLLGYLVYQSFFLDLFPYVGASQYVSAFVLNPYFIFFLGFTGYLFSPSPFLMKKGEKHE